MQLRADKQETAGLKTDCTVHGDEASTEVEEGKHISSVDDKEVFRKSVKESLAGIIMEISEFICWLYRQADQQEENIEVIISEHPEVADLLKTLSTVFRSMRSASDREAL